MAEKWSNEKQGEAGPSWWDIHQQWFHIEAVYSCKVAVSLTLCRAVNGQLGSYMQASVSGVAVQGIGSGFGRAYVNGAKTMPGALSRLLWAVEDRIIEQRTAAAALTQRALEDMLAHVGGDPTEKPGE